MVVSDDDEGALLSEARPRRAKPLSAVAGTRDGHAETGQLGLARGQATGTSLAMDCGKAR